jgi:Fic family protein
MFDRDKPFNTLPALPPAGDIETTEVLKKAISASRAMAELKGVAERMPNQAMLIDSLVLQEARASSEIENILTSNDDVYRAASDETLPASAEAKEVLRYRQALNHGCRQIKTRPLSTCLFVEIAQRIKEMQFDIRRLPGTRIANSKGETIYTPPEGETVIRDKLRELENFMHADDKLDVLVKMALMHYQFEAIHPFPDGNGRTGRILNILYLVEQGLLNLPVLYLSRYIIDHKETYYERLRRVTEENAWHDWVLYMLDAVEQTSIRTHGQIAAILTLMETVRERVQRETPSIYSKDLIEQIFRQPYCKIAFLERAGMGTRQTCAKYLRELEIMGILKGQKMGREVYFINTDLFKLLTQ